MQPQPPPLSTHATPSTWIGRNWKWFVPSLIAGAVFVLLLFIGTIIMLVLGMMRSSEPYQEAFRLAQENPVVVEALGTPLKERFFMTGNISVSGSGGKADLVIPVSGPKGKGTIYLDAERNLGKWHFNDLLIEIDSDSQRIPLLP
nr:cytochrome c oxidase assembly factor Coa1 family protein [Oscillatoria laete-virens]